jgi:hypothetical protein
MPDCSDVEERQAAANRSEAGNVDWRNRARAQQFIRVRADEPVIVSNREQIRWLEGDQHIPYPYREVRHLSAPMHWLFNQRSTKFL